MVKHIPCSIWDGLTWVACWRNPLANDHVSMTGVGKCPNWTSPNYWGYHLQQIWEGDVQNPQKGSKRDIYQPLYEMAHKWALILPNLQGELSWSMALPPVFFRFFACWLLISQLFSSRQRVFQFTTIINITIINTAQWNTTSCDTIQFEIT